MSRRTDRARRKLERLIAATDRDCNKAAREFADAVRGLTPAEMRAVVAAASRRQVDAFVRVLRAGLRAAARQGAYTGAGVAEAGDRAAAAWIDSHAAEVSARWSRELHVQGARMAREMVTTIAQIVREGDSALEAARLLRDKIGSLPAARISAVARKAADGARRMVALSDTATAKLYAPRIARLRSYASRLGQMHADSSGRLAYGMRASASHLAAQIEKAVAAGRTDLVDRAVEWHAYDKRAYTDRVRARTEISRAYHEAFIGTSSEEPWVVGYRWKLDRRAGRKRDICDVHAGVNRYGMGAGVFPQGKLPEIPAHPNCLCFLEDVIDDNVETESDRPPTPKEREKAEAEWLRRQPASVRAEILGVERARQFAATGRLPG